MEQLILVCVPMEAAAVTVVYIRLFDDDDSFRNAVILASDNGIGELCGPISPRRTLSMSCHICEYGKFNQGEMNE